MKHAKVAPRPLVKDAAPFPIPLDTFFRAWHHDGTLRNRLRAALALGYEMESKEPVLVDSIVDERIKFAISAVFKLRAPEEL